MATTAARNVAKQSNGSDRFDRNERASATRQQNVNAARGKASSIEHLREHPP